MHDERSNQPQRPHSRSYATYREQRNRPSRGGARRWLVWLLALFLIVPLIELALFIEIGQLIGTLQTITLIFVSGIIGALLVRSQGAIVIFRITDNVRQGHLPADEVIEGLLVLVGGALLLTPGFFTDILGIMLLAPTTRAWFRERLKKYLLQKARSYLVRIDMQ